MIRIAEGIRVLEVASWTYVPAAGVIMAEWGADVVKIEHPESGDPQRGLVTSGLLPPGPGGTNFMMELPNRGKRSVGVDLKSPQGHQVLLDLVVGSDVFLTNFLPAVRSELGLEVEDLRRVNPDIIYVRGSGQGQRGPEKDRGGYDSSSYWARAVAAVATPSESEYPIIQPGPAFGDMYGGLSIALGIAGALFHRQRTGEALVVDSSLQATGMWGIGASIMMADVYGSHMSMGGDRTATPNPLVNTYRTKDGRFVNLVMLQGPRFWPEFVVNAGRSDWLEDPRFTDGKWLGENKAECVRELDALFAARTLDEWRPVLDKGRGVWAPVYEPKELLTEAQAADNGYIRDISGPDGATFRAVPSPVQFNETPPDLVRAPDHGEHTDAVLSEIGYDDDKIIELKLSGAVL